MSGQRAVGPLALSTNDEVAPVINPSFTYAEQSGWSILGVSGEVDMATAPRLRQRLIAISASGVTQLVLDLEDCDFLDSTALGVIVGSLKRLRTNDGHLRVVCTQPSLLKLFDLTGLNTVLDIHDSRESALGPLVPPPKGSGNE